MSHNLDTTAGQTAFVSAREDAWHRLGTTLDSTFDANQAMEHGLLGGWNVRKTPVVAALETGEMLPMPGRYATVRTNPVDGSTNVLGNVGEAYTPIQNEEHAELLNTLVDESGAHFETAGAIDGGRKVFITMKLPGHMRVGGVDAVENYIAAVNSHDGSQSFTLLVTPVRVVCQNTMNLAFSAAKSSFRIRHSRGADKVLRTQAREALDMTFNYLEGFQSQADALIQTSLTQTRFEQIISEAYGAGPDAAPSTVSRTGNKLDAMVELFADARTQEGIRDTAWAGLNAVTEWADHFAPTRGEDRDGTRARNAVFDPSFKNVALELFLAEAGVSA